MGVILTLGTMIVGIVIPVLVMLYTGWDVVSFSMQFYLVTEAKTLELFQMLNLTMYYLS